MKVSRDLGSQSESSVGDHSRRKGGLEWAEVGGGWGFLLTGHVLSVTGGQPPPPPTPSPVSLFQCGGWRPSYASNQMARLAKMSHLSNATASATRARVKPGMGGIYREWCDVIG